MTKPTKRVTIVAEGRTRTSYVEDDEILDELRRMSESTGVSISELVRNATRNMVEQNKDAKSLTLRSKGTMAVRFTPPSKPARKPAKSR